MLEKDFYKFCEEVLSKLFDELEKMDKNSNLDLDYSDGILKIVDIKSRKTYVINRNSGNQKIWYSSPLTGADYFAFDEKENIWLNDKKEGLHQKLVLELSYFL